MARTLKFAALAAALMLSATVVGASAFTSADITRDAEANVVADDSALVTLTAGDSNIATTTANGDELEISAQDLNSGGEFRFNDAFGVNLAGEPTDTYEVTVESSSTVFTDFEIYDDSGSVVSTDNDNDGTVELSGNTDYTVGLNVSTDSTVTGETISIGVSAA